MEKPTKIRIVPLKGEPYEIGEGKECINLMQMKSGQYIQSPFTPTREQPVEVLKDKYPPRQCFTPNPGKSWKGLGAK